VPESFAPVTLQNDTGVKLNAAYFNRLEANIETIDDRAAALELGVASPVVLTYATSITIDASLGSLFRVVATGNVSIADIVNGSNGQEVVLEVQASGAERTVTFAGGAVASVTVPVGQWWAGRFRYNSVADSWLLASSGGTGGSTASPAGHGRLRLHGHDQRGDRVAVPDHGDRAADDRRHRRRRRRPADRDPGARLGRGPVA
jgi:hypothetical protein